MGGWGPEGSHQHHFLAFRFHAPLAASLRCDMKRIETGAFLQRKGLHLHGEAPRGQQQLRSGCALPACSRRRGDCAQAALLSSLPNAQSYTNAVSVAYRSPQASFAAFHCGAPFSQSPEAAHSGIGRERGMPLTTCRQGDQQCQPPGWRATRARGGFTSLLSSIQSLWLGSSRTVPPSLTTLNSMKPSLCAREKCPSGHPGVEPMPGSIRVNGQGQASSQFLRRAISSLMLSDLGERGFKRNRGRTRGGIKGALRCEI